MPALYDAYIKALDRFDLAYLHVMRAFVNKVDTDVVAMARRIYRGKIIACGGYTGETGAELIASGGADAVGYGQLFISNPDLPTRFKTGAALATPDQTTFYTPGPKGYIDYPMMGEV